MSAVHHVLLSFVIRLGFIAYGEYQDRVMHVPYTDVDYHVFTGAAEHVARGESPYRRATYRYTPLLAWMLYPTVTYPAFGKLLFSAFDVLAGLLIYKLTRVEALSKRVAVSCAALWWYNPLPVTICSRGNAESIVICLVLLTVYLARRRSTFLAGVMLGVAVHMKIYPVVLAPALYWTLGEGHGPRRWLAPNSARVSLVLGAVFSFVAATLECYVMYGDEFLEHTYLYHLTRRDVRHNFSIFFYLLDRTHDFGLWALGLVTFLPQIILILAFSIRYHRLRDLPFCSFCVVYTFVSFNKVCTSQYFLWYLSLLPPVLPRIACSWKENLFLLCLWYFAQGSWLFTAYLLEFEGRPIHRLVWAESVAFFCANIGILARLVRKYDAKPPAAPRRSRGGGKERVAGAQAGRTSSREVPGAEATARQRTGRRAT